MFEIIDTNLQPAPDLGRPVSMGDDRQSVRTGFLDNGAALLEGHQVVLDQLDHIHAGIGEPLDLGACVLGSIHAPTVILGAWIGCFLDKRAGPEHARPVDLARFEALLDTQRILQRGSQVARRGDASEQ